MPPAQECLGTDQAAGGEVDLWLVVQLELGVGEGSAELGLEVDLPLNLFFHSEGEEFFRSRLLSLRPIHREIGVSHQFGG